MSETQQAKEGTEESSPPSARDELLALGAEFEARAGTSSELTRAVWAAAAQLARQRAEEAAVDANGSGDGSWQGSAVPRAHRGAEGFPPGEFSRVELPGYVSWTGWVTEETFAGAGVLVVRDSGGTIRARVSAGAFRQVIPLPPPGPGEGQYDGQLALTAGDEAEDAWADDRDGEAF